MDIIYDKRLGLMVRYKDVENTVSAIRPLYQRKRSFRLENIQEGKYQQTPTIMRFASLTAQQIRIDNDEQSCHPFANDAANESHSLPFKP